ncbi:hypothetical protein GCM10010129_73360 [Streptomyces fumigatiscleroticus]|nr:hypothetical protein GCM10010129_73360 [Streptomyces fumigatiscleroticus]
MTQTCFPVGEDIQHLAETGGLSPEQAAAASEYVQRALAEMYQHALAAAGEQFGVQDRAEPSPTNQADISSPPASVPRAYAAPPAAETEASPVDADGSSPRSSGEDPEHLSHLDLSELLTEAAELPEAASVPPGPLTADLVLRRTAERPLPHLVDLTLDTAVLNTTSLRRVAGWAARTLSADLAHPLPDLRTAADTDAIRSAQRLLNTYDRILAGDLSPQEDARTFLSTVRRELDAVRAGLPHVSSPPSPESPVVHVVRSLADAEHLLHDLAQRLGAHLRAELDIDGERYTRWADPDGRVHAFDPALTGTGERTTLSSRQAQEAGLLTPAARRTVDELHFDGRELAALYRSSWTARRTFAEAVHLAVESRRERLAVLDPRLPRLLPRLSAVTDAPDTAQPAQEEERLLGDTRVFDGDSLRTLANDILAVVRGQQPATPLTPMVDRLESRPAPAGVERDAFPSAADTPPGRGQLVIEDLLDASLSARDDFGHVVAIWLPGAVPAAGELTDATLVRLTEFAALEVDGDIGPGTRTDIGSGGLTFVFAATGDDEVPGSGPGDVSADTLAGVLHHAASGRTPVLMMPGAEAFAARLAQRWDGPVVAARFGGVLDSRNGTLSAAAGSEAYRAGTGFRLYTRDDPQGVPAFTQLRAAPWDTSLDTAEPGTRIDTVTASEAQAAPSDDPENTPPGTADTAQPLAIDPIVRTAGTPRAGLPFMSQMIRRLRELTARRGAVVEESVWTNLPRYLLSNYRYLVPDPDDLYSDDPAPGGWRTGLPVPLGPGIEALVTLHPTDPQVVRSPAGSYDRPVPPRRADARPTRLETIAEEEEAADHDSETDTVGSAPDGPARLLRPRPASDRFHANQLVKGTFLTGAYVSTHAGPTSATRANVTLSAGIGTGLGWLDAVRLSLQLSGSANASTRSTSHIADAEGGHVEIGDTDATLVAYQARWSVKLRTDDRTPWEAIQPTEVTTTGDERLMLYLAEHYLGTPGPAVTAQGPEVDATRLPSAFTASGLTGLPPLMDEILKVLRQETEAAGLSWKTTIGSLPYNELIDKLWSLDAHLDDAVNKPYGYRIDLNDGKGVIASVELHSERLTPGSLVGATTDKAPIENVRTAIDGGSGSHALTQSSGASLSLAVDTGPVAGEMGYSLSAGMNWSSTDSLSAGRVGLWVLVPRYIGYTSAYEVMFSHRARVTVRSRPPVMTSSVRGRALLRTPEPEAFRYGFPVERAALKATGSGVNSERASQPAASAPPAAVHDGAPSTAPMTGAPSPATGTVAEEPSDTRPPEDNEVVPYAPDSLRRTGRREGDPAHRPLPPYIEDGRGIGTGIAKVEPATVTAIYDWLSEELKRTGFLPAEPTTPLTERTRYTHRSTRESRMENQALFDKMVSERAFDSYFDQIHQTGHSFALRVRRGALATDLWTDHATITIRAGKSPGTAATYEGSTDAEAAVNLAMGMGNTEQSVSGFRRIVLSLRARLTPFRQLKSTGFGFDLFRQIGASHGVNHMHNRPELLEYRGILHQHKLFSDYTVTVEYGRSGLARNRRRRSEPYQLTKQPTLVSLLPLGDTSDPGISYLDRTPASVLKHAAIHYLDATGLPEAATTILGPLTGPEGNADQELKAFTRTISIRAFAKEIITDPWDTAAGDATGNSQSVLLVPDSAEAGGDGYRVESVPASAEYTSDQFFDPGWWRDAKAGVDISGTMNRTEFAGATDHPFVLGRILLSLGQTSGSDTTTRGYRHTQFDLTVGGPADPADPAGLALQGGMDAGRSQQWNGTQGEGRTSAKEYIQLDFNRAYAFETTVDYTVRSRLEKDGKFAVFDSDSSVERVNGRKLLFVLSEPTALEEYGKGHLPVSDRQLVDVMRRWHSGDVPLRGDTVATTLTRWVKDTPELPADLSAQLPADRKELARLLSRLHADGAIVIQEGSIGEAFGEAFGLEVGDPDDVYADRRLPEYLTREDPGGRTLGHSGVHDLTHKGGRTTFDIVRDQVDKVAPGLLAARADLWDGNGRRIGRLQGGVNSLQTMLAKGRDLTLFDDLLSPHGLSLYLANPIGWLLGDIVEINLSAELTSQPRIKDFRPNTGLENYGHAYTSERHGRSVDTSQSVNVARLGSGDAHVFGQGRLGMAQGQHRGSARSETATTEQTVYDWNGHYRVELNEVFKVRVRRIDMAGRPITAALTGWYRARDAYRSRGSSIEVPGVLEIQVPRGLGEFRPVLGPQLPGIDPRPLPPLPGDAYVAGTMVDGAQPAIRKLLARMFGPEADGSTKRTAVNINQLFTRTAMNNHLRNAAGTTDLLTEQLFQPGRSRRRARLWLTGDFYELEVLGTVRGTGTGRYSKHQSGTTHSASHESWRPTTAGAPSGSYGVPDVGELRQLTPGTNTEVSLTTSSTQAGAGTANYRREEHVKQQGPLQLVRLRGRFHLVSKRYDRNLLLPDTEHPRAYTSGKFAGDIYVQIFEEELEELRRRHEAAPYPASEAHDWRGLDDAPVFDLSALLAEAARERGASAARAHQLVAQAMSEGSDGELPHAVLVFDLAEWERRAVIEQYRWAVKTLSAEVTRAREVNPQVREPHVLIQYRDYLADRPDRIDPPGIATPADTVFIDIPRRVEEARRRITGDDESRLWTPLPPMAGIYALGHTSLVRGIAAELQAHLKVVFTRGGNPVMTRWVEPGGRVHAFSPYGRLEAGPPGLSPDEAQDAGLLTDELRRGIELLDLDDQELHTLYAASRDDRRDFDEAVQKEITARLERLHHLDPRLPRLLHRAAELTLHAAPLPDGVAADEVHEALNTMRQLARVPRTLVRSRLADSVQQVLDVMSAVTPVTHQGEAASSGAGGREPAGTVFGEDGVQVPSDSGTKAFSRRTDAALVWNAVLEEDAKGFTPELSKYPDYFPMTRQDAWQRYLTSFEQHSLLKASAEEAADSGPDAIASHRVALTAAELGLTRDRRALTAWGHDDPEALLTRYRRLHPDAGAIGPFAPAHETATSRPADSATDLTPQTTLRSQPDGSEPPSADPAEQAPGDHEPATASVYYARLDEPEQNRLRATLLAHLLTLTPGTAHYSNVRKSLQSWQPRPAVVSRPSGRPVAQETEGNDNTSSANPAPVTSTGAAVPPPYTEPNDPARPATDAAAAQAGTPADKTAHGTPRSFLDKPRSASILDEHGARAERAVGEVTDRAGAAHAAASDLRSTRPAREERRSSPPPPAQTGPLRTAQRRADGVTPGSGTPVTGRASADHAGDATSTGPSLGARQPWTPKRRPDQVATRDNPLRWQDLPELTRLLHRLSDSANANVASSSQVATTLDEVVEQYRIEFAGTLKQSIDNRLREADIDGRTQDVYVDLDDFPGDSTQTWMVHVLPHVAELLDHSLHIPLASGVDLHVCPPE